MLNTNLFVKFVKDLKIILDWAGELSANPCPVGYSISADTIYRRACCCVLLPLLKIIENS